MPKIKLYQNNGKGNKKVLEEIAREFFESNYIIANLPNVSVIFIKGTDENGLTIFDSICKEVDKNEIKNA